MKLRLALIILALVISTISLSIALQTYERATKISQNHPQIDDGLVVFLKERADKSTWPCKTAGVYRGSDFDEWSVSSFFQTKSDSNFIFYYGVTNVTAKGEIVGTSFGVAISQDDKTLNYAYKAEGKIVSLGKLQKEGIRTQKYLANRTIEYGLSQFPAAIAMDQNQLNQKLETTIMPNINLLTGQVLVFEKIEMIVIPGICPE